MFLTKRMRDWERDFSVADMLGEDGEGLNCQIRGGRAALGKEQTEKSSMVLESSMICNTRLRK